MLVCNKANGFMLKEKGVIPQNMDNSFLFFNSYF